MRSLCVSLAIGAIVRRTEVDTAGSLALEKSLPCGKASDRACEWIPSCTCNTGCGETQFDGHDISKFVKSNWQRGIAMHPWIGCDNRLTRYAGDDAVSLHCEEGMTYPEPEDTVCSHCQWEYGFSCGKEGYEKMTPASVVAKLTPKVLCCRPQTCARVRATREGELSLSGVQAQVHWVDPSAEPPIAASAACETTAHLTGREDWSDKVAGELKVYKSSRPLRMGPPFWPGAGREAPVVEMMGTRPFPEYRPFPEDGAGGTELRGLGQAVQGAAHILGLPLGGR